jgi:hypothetical protein
MYPAWLERASRVGVAALVVTVGVCVAASGETKPAHAVTTCAFTTASKTMKLNGDCTTDASIIVPNGFTLDGAGFTVTGVDPPAGHFVGGVIQNGGATASVTNLRVTVSGLDDICDPGAARLRGILFDGAGGSITNTRVESINQGASGCQEGNGIEVRNLEPGAKTVKVDIVGNRVTNYQKTGVVANGAVSARIANNVVDGGGPVGYIARNGIQVGFGAEAHVQSNTVSGNSYTGNSTASGGILVVGGPGNGGDFCVNSQIVGNTLTGNDVGVYLSQYEADSSAPARATNIKVINNTISHGAVTNGFVYQAGISDVGNNDKLINNTISGSGYNPSTLPGSTFAVDADASFTNRAKVHANK